MKINIQLKVSSYEFACFIEYLLKEHGIEKSSAGFDFDTGWRDIHFDNIDVPLEAHYIPRPIEIHPPED